MQLLNFIIGGVAKYNLIPVSIQSRYIRKSLEVLRENFELVPVINPALAEEAARIRYEVYCQDYTGFESPENFPDKKEVDAFDDRSLQVLLRFKPTSIFIGTVRLVTPLTGENFMQSYPTQELCDDPVFKDKGYISRTCEVSRFCISRKRRNSLRKFMNEQSFNLIRPFICLELIAGLIKTAHEHGFDDLCGVMEPWLIEKLKKSGWHFKEVGPAVEFHGLRQPCMGTIAAGLEGMKKQYPDIWKYIMDTPSLWRSKDAVQDANYEKLDCGLYHEGWSAYARA